MTYKNCAQRFHINFTLTPIIFDPNYLDTDGIRVNSSVNGVATHYLVDKNRLYAQVLRTVRIN